MTLDYDALPISFALVEARRLRLRLDAYRDCVARVAAGEEVEAVDMTAATNSMPRLGLPGYTLRRDVQAMAAMRLTRCENRRLELEVLYPHLFEPADEWVERRLATIRQRRGGTIIHPVGAAGPAR